MPAFVFNKTFFLLSVVELKKKKILSSERLKNKKKKSTNDCRIKRANTPILFRMTITIARRIGTASSISATARTISSRTTTTTAVAAAIFFAGLFT